MRALLITRESVIDLELELYGMRVKQVDPQGGYGDLVKIGRGNP